MHFARQKDFARQRDRLIRRRAMPAGVAAAALALLLSGCTDWYAPDLSLAPTGLEATDNLTNRIELNWNDYPAQVLYLVYRSEGEDGPFEEAIAYTTTSAYVDTDVGIAEYSYVVRAADLTDTTRTSPESARALGQVDASDAEWQGGQTVVGGVASIHFTVDGEGVRYMATVADTVDAAPTLRRYNAETGVWTVPADAFGAVADATTRPVAAAVDDVPYLFFADAARSGKLSVQALDEDVPEDEDPTMDTVDAESVSTGPVSWLTATSTDLGAVAGWVEDIDAESGLGAIRATIARDGAVSPAPSPAASEVAPALAPVADGVLLATFDAAEGEAGTIRVRKYNGTAWTDVADRAVAAPGVVHESLILATASENRFWVAYVEASGPSHVVYEYSEGDWTDLSPPAAGAPVFGSGSSLGLDYQPDEALYLFLRSGDDGRGVVLRRADAADAAWQTFSPEEFTADANVGNLFLSTVEGFVYAAYTEAGFGGGVNARTRFFE